MKKKKIIYIYINKFKKNNNNNFRKGNLKYKINFKSFLENIYI